jgi:hypothetical protein
LLPLSPESPRIAAFSLTASSYRSRIMSFLDKVKKASKGVIDAGAKTMLKVSFKRAALEGFFCMRPRPPRIGRVLTCLLPLCCLRSLPRTN